MQLVKFAALSLRSSNWIVLLEKTTEDKFYKPVIGFLEAGKLNGILKSLNLMMPLFIVKLERHFQIFSTDQVSLRKKRLRNYKL